MSKQEKKIQDANRLADTMNAKERGAIYRLESEKARVQEAFKTPGMKESVLEYIFNSEIPYENNPLSEYRK
jgi:hypothetical protein